MKMTMTDGTVFEGTLKEYAELIAFAETQQAINEAKEAEESKPKLKAGDFVKFEEPDLIDITVGKIYEVQADEYGDLCIIDDGGDEDYSYLAQFAIKVDADEAAKQRESAKWSQIGRKVGEFRKGDIVRVIKDVCAKPVGTIFEVNHAGKHIVSCNEGYAYDTDANVELIAPVESTLN